MVVAVAFGCCHSLVVLLTSPQWAASEVMDQSYRPLSFLSSALGCAAYMLKEVCRSEPRVREWQRAVSRESCRWRRCLLMLAGLRSESAPWRSQSAPGRWKSAGIFQRPETWRNENGGERMALICRDGWQCCLCKVQVYLGSMEQKKPPNFWTNLFYFKSWSLNCFTLDTNRDHWGFNIGITHLCLINKKSFKARLPVHIKTTEEKRLTFKWHQRNQSFATNRPQSR